MSKNDNDNDTRRQQALDELKKLVADQRARLDPAVLEQVAAAIASPENNRNASEPYDRAAATKAVELFLSQHKDKADFRQRLFAFIRQQSH